MRGTYKRIPSWDGKKGKECRAGEGGRGPGKRPAGKRLRRCLKLRKRERNQGSMTDFHKAALSTELESLAPKYSKFLLSDGGGGRTIFLFESESKMQQGVVGEKFNAIGQAMRGGQKTREGNQRVSKWKGACESEQWNSGRPSQAEMCPKSCKGGLRLLPKKGHQRTAPGIYLEKTLWGGAKSSLWGKTDFSMRVRWRELGIFMGSPLGSPLSPESLFRAIRRGVACHQLSLGRL